MKTNPFLSFRILIPAALLLASDAVLAQSQFNLQGHATCVGASIHQSW